MTSHPFVTWLLPVRNGMPYLPLTLESITRQTYKHHKIIAWDNGSTDGTLEELKRWIPSRIPGQIVSDRPMPLGRSLAALVEMADTELCARIDADDINFRTRLESQVSFLLANPQVGILGSQIELIDERGCAKRESGWQYPTNDAELRWLTRWHAQFCHPSVMFRKTVVLRAGNYHDAQPFEDLDLAMRLAAITEFANLPEKLLKYRRSQMSSTGATSDFIQSDRHAAVKNTSMLFPNLQNAQRAMELWEATHPRQLDSKCRIAHIRQLERAAFMLAETFSKPADYFRRAESFAKQHYSLKTRIYRGFGLMPLVTLKARLSASLAYRVQRA